MVELVVLSAVGAAAEAAVEVAAAVEAAAVEEVVEAATGRRRLVTRKGRRVEVGPGRGVVVGDVAVVVAKGQNELGCQFLRRASQSATLM